MTTSGSANRRRLAWIVVVLAAVQGPRAASAQFPPDPQKQEGGRIVPAPAPAPRPNHKPRFGVRIANFNNGRLQAVWITSVIPGSPAARVRVQSKRPNGAFVLGPITTMIRGDIITRIVETKTGFAWRIRKSDDLGAAIQALPPGAEFEISGYDAGNHFRPFTAVAWLPVGHRGNNGGVRPPGGGSRGGQALHSGESNLVRTLLIADTDANLPGLKEDLNMINDLLEHVRADDRCTLDVMTGNNVNRVNVLDWLRNQGDVSQDTVFIYYAGHGGTDMNSDPDLNQRTSGHYLALTHGQPLFRSTLRGELDRLHPRLAILITECCSKVAPVPLAEPEFHLPREGRMNPQLTHCLFLKARGTVDITAATFNPRAGDDESAWTGPDGGFFTDSLHFALFHPEISFRGLDLNGDDLVTWNEAFSITRFITDEYYKSYMGENLQDQDLQAQTNQRPWAFSLAKLTEAVEPQRLQVVPQAPRDQEGEQPGSPRIQIIKEKLEQTSIPPTEDEIKKLPGSGEPF